MKVRGDYISNIYVLYKSPSADDSVRDDVSILIVFVIASLNLLGWICYSKQA